MQLWAMYVIKERGSINYINILLKSQRRGRKGPKTGRRRSVAIDFKSPLEIYLVPAEERGLEKQKQKVLANAVALKCSQQAPLDFLSRGKKKRSTQRTWQSG